MFLYFVVYGVAIHHGIWSHHLPQHGTGAGGSHAYDEHDDDGMYDVILSSDPTLECDEFFSLLSKLVRDALQGQHTNKWLEQFTPVLTRLVKQLRTHVSTEIHGNQRTDKVRNGSYAMIIAYTCGSCMYMSSHFMRETSCYILM